MIQSITINELVPRQLLNQFIDNWYHNSKFHHSEAVDYSLMCWSIDEFSLVNTPMDVTGYCTRCWRVLKKNWIIAILATTCFNWIDLITVIHFLAFSKAARKVKVGFEGSVASVLSARKSLSLCSLADSCLKAVVFSYTHRSSEMNFIQSIEWIIEVDVNCSILKW